MSISLKKLFVTSLIFSQILASKANKSYADSIILNKETTCGVNIRADNNINSDILGGIEDYSIYEIKNEDEYWYEIEFEGKRSFVGKSWFYRLNESVITDATNLKNKPESASSNALTYKLQPKTKITILEFVKDSDFVKVSYDENLKDNFKINVIDINNKDKKSGVEKLTLDDGSSKKDLPKVITLEENKISNNLNDENKINEEKEPVTGYVKLSSLSISKKDKKYLEKLKKSYEEMNRQIAEHLAYEKEIEDDYYDYYSTIIEVPVTGNPVGVDLYEWACQYLGSPYVYGGTSLTDGIDCSGFTMQIYNQIGVALPHLAQSQQEYGVEIPFGQEQAGDLVFFGTSLNDITHVGMADGNGNMIHASSPRTGIIISPINNPISIKRIVE